MLCILTYIFTYRVFIDADKKAYKDYLLDLLGYNNDLVQQKPSLLEKGALILIDNTLWKGLVLSQVPKFKSHSPEFSSFGNENRMKVLSQALHEFNTFIKDNLSEEFEVVLLPLRDGLTMLRYKKWYVHKVPPR